MLDESLRERIRALSSSEVPGSELSSDAQERIVARTLAAAREQVRVRERNRRIRIIALPLAAAAAAVCFVGLRHGGNPEAPPPGTAVVAARNTPSPEVVQAPAARLGEPAARAEEAPPASPERSPLACAARPVAAERPVFVRSAAGRTLELGALATVVARGGARVELAESAPCRTVLALDSGTVVVHAKDLGGGDFVVHTRLGEVSVHGTRFSVSLGASSLLVEVTEGRVWVDSPRTNEVLAAGSWLRLYGGRAERGELSMNARRALESDLEAAEKAPVASRHIAQRGTPPAVAQDVAPADEKEVASEEPSSDVPPSRGDLLDRAEAARRAKQWDEAAELYRQVGAGSGPTAEAAWLALARMELGRGRPDAALAATSARAASFGRGTFAPEALWIDVRAVAMKGDSARAAALSEQLIRDYPATPQAGAARRRLESER